jgi:hypothetical protein
VIHSPTPEAAAYLQEVLGVARLRGVQDRLQRRLDYLSNYANDGEDKAHTKCVLVKDFAPLSFFFTMLSRKNPTEPYECWFCGGLVFHGAHDGYGSGAAPTLSVSVEPVEDDWSVCT